MALNAYGNNIRNTSREVPAPAVIQHTLDDLDMVAVDLANFTRVLGEAVKEQDLSADEIRLRFPDLSRAQDLLTYRRGCLARWIRQHDTPEPALRAAGRGGTMKSIITQRQFPLPDGRTIEADRCGENDQIPKGLAS